MFLRYDSYEEYQHERLKREEYRKEYEKRESERAKQRERQRQKAIVSSLELTFALKEGFFSFLSSFSLSLFSSLPPSLSFLFFSFFLCCRLENKLKLRLC